MSLAPEDPRHGTRNGYGNLGCRCDACREASTEYLRARGWAGYAKDACACGGLKRVVSKQCRACENAEREAPHGTETRYKRCRCELCRTAAADAKQRRRARSRQPCVHGCGTLVVTINRDYPDKPLECRSCAMKRVNAARRKTAA